MDLLLIDIGNTQIKRVKVSGGAFGATVYDPIADLDRVSAEIADMQLPVTFSCVRPGAAEKVKATLNNKKIQLIEVNHLIDKPVSGFYAGIGADRVANAIGAWSEYSHKQPVAAIDLGTGTTITAVSTDGKFAGGFVTLGLAAICKTLTEALPHLPVIDPKKIDNLDPSFDPYTVLCRGTVAAHIGIIEKWIEIFRTKLGADTVFVATGGWSQVLAPFLPSLVKIDPLLTLKGIGAIANLYNTKN